MCATLAVALSAPITAQAMEFRVAGNELHLSGRVVGDELGKFKDVESGHGRAIDTVVFRNSPGGDAWTAYRIGERIRDAGWRTVVVGRCHSACAVMFLGGRSRHFAQASRPELVYLAFHGTWSGGFLEPQSPAFRGRVELRNWIIARTGGKADPALIDRFIQNERRATFLYAYDPRQFKREDGSSMYFCEGAEAKGAKPFEACEKIAGKDAFSMGFVTSEERIRVTPPARLSAPLY